MAHNEVEGTIELFTNPGVTNGDGVLVQRLDGSNNVLNCSGTASPPVAAGYAVGCEYIKINAATGQCSRWINQGTALISSFRPLGPVMGYGFYLAGGPVPFVSGTAGLIVNLPASVVATDIAFAEYTSTDDNDQLISVIAAADKLTITNAADPISAHATVYALLRSGCIPDYDIFAAGTYTTVGGNAAEAITVAGALATDLAFVQYAATDDTDTIAKSVVTANTLTVTMSADPLTAHALHYVILRPRGSFKPSHYVFAAGTYTTVGGAAAEAITVAGALATDVAIVKYAVTNDTDAIRKAVITANTLTVTMSADPLTAHALSYMILRAY